MNEQTQDNRQQSYFLENFYSISNELNIIEKHEKSDEHIAKFNTSKSILIQGAFCNFSLALITKFTKHYFTHT